MNWPWYQPRRGLRCILRGKCLRRIVAHRIEFEAAPRSAVDARRRYDPGNRIQRVGNLGGIVLRFLKMRFHNWRLSKGTCCQFYLGARIFSNLLGRSRCRGKSEVLLQSIRRFCSLWEVFLLPSACFAPNRSQWQLLTLLCRSRSVHGADDRRRVGAGPIRSCTYCFSVRCLIYHFQISLTHVRTRSSSSAYGLQTHRSTMPSCGFHGHGYVSTTRLRLRRIVCRHRNN